MADTILNIQTGAIDAPYQEFTETIPAVSYTHLTLPTKRIV